MKSSTPTGLDRYRMAGEIKGFARRLGFDFAGVAPAGPTSYRDYFRRWLDDGKHGEMVWLAERFEERTDPGVYLPGARSVICVALNYHADLEEVSPEERGSVGRVARYALGGDYHERIKQRLYDLADWVRDTFGGQTRCAVDTAPVMERELAARAGIGWVGKHTLVINERAGSWLLLGEVLTTLELAYDDPAIDRCGNCRRCIDACPTGAITGPYELDARRCISYLTIEHRGPIDEDLARQTGEWLFGCDVCQDVCPFNAKAPHTVDPIVRPRLTTGTLDLRQVLSWGEEEYRVALRKSAMKRVKLPVLQRNAAIALRNKGVGVETRNVKHEA